MSKNLKLVKVKSIKEVDPSKYEDGTIIVTAKTVNIVIEGTLRKLG